MKETNKLNLSRKIDSYKGEILLRNYINLKKFTSGGMIITGVIALVSVVFSSSVYFVFEYCFCFVYFVLSNLFTNFILKKNIKYTLLVFYIELLPIYGVGILMGTFLDPGSNAITIIILLCTLSMFITDKPHRVVSYVLGIAAVFLVCSYLCKPSELKNVRVSDTAVIEIKISLGCSICRSTGHDFDDVYKSSDDALYESKQKGKNCYTVREL